MNIVAKVASVHSEAARALRDVSRAAKARELELLAQIADLERQNRALLSENAHLKLRGAPKLPPEFVRVSAPQNSPPLHLPRLSSRNAKRTDGTGATTSSRSGASPKVQGRAQ